MVGKLSFVTVVFESEFSLLRIQARSMALFLSRDLVAEIIVIDNSARGMPAKQRASFLADIGPLRDIVRILRPAEICLVPATLGWRSQQVLKLAVARLLTAERFVVLDAKNHFVRTPGLGFFEAPDGRPRVNVYGYRSHPLLPDLVRVLNYCGLDPALYVDSFTATVTPFVLDTATVRAMMTEIETRSGKSFATEFVERQLLEFFLYSAWIVAGGRELEQAFDLHQVFCPNIWPRSGNPEGVRAAIDQAETNQAPLFSIHRRALARLDPVSLELLIGYWLKLGLFLTEQEAKLFVVDFRRSFRRAEVVRKLRESVLKARTSAPPALVRKVTQFPHKWMDRSAAGQSPPGRGAD